MHEKSQHAKSQVYQVVEQLEIGGDLPEVFGECTLVAHDAH